MQVNNNINYNYNNPNFKSVDLGRAEKILEERLSPKQFKTFKEALTKKFGKSPIKMKIDSADGFGDRLDAQIYLRKGDVEEHVYMEESKLANLFNINPMKFLKKVGKKFEEIEKKFGFLF